MTIDISDVLSCEDKEVVKQVQIEFRSFSSKLGDFPIREAAPIALQIANRANKRLILQGQADLTVLIPCSRCLTEVPTTVRFSIDKELRITEDGVKDEDMEETDYLAGAQLDIDRLVYEELLIHWPTKILCKDDCKGICKACGQNLNIGSCECRKKELDPRMAAALDVFNKFKEV